MAAFLWAQLECAKEITNRRLELWKFYHAELESLEKQGLLRRPIIPEACKHNAHMYYVLVNSESIRNVVLTKLKAKGIFAVFHYVPLHSASAAKKFCQMNTKLPNTDDLSSRIIRLPLWVEMTNQQQSRVISELSKVITTSMLKTA